MKIVTKLKCRMCTQYEICVKIVFYTVALNRGYKVRPFKKPRSNNSITLLANRCDRVKNVHASHRVHAHVHVGPVFNGGVLIC